MKAVSLFTGAGGMDIGFSNAGIEIVVSSELNHNACETYLANHPGAKVIEGDVLLHMDEFKEYEGKVDLVFGGPPCQGFSVAGKMDPDDPRSKLIFTFCDIVEFVKPNAFVMENVKALGKLEKWAPIRQKYLERMDNLGYDVRYLVLNASHFGVPQKRERVFFIGFKKNLHIPMEKLAEILDSKKESALTIRELFNSLPEHGSEGNPCTCRAKVTCAASPVMRSSPYAGMYFNGQGRPIDIDGYANTLPASMGGNKTPIIDEIYLKDKSAGNWIAEYHQGLVDKTISPVFMEAPSHVRRISVIEAAAIQTFPRDYIFCGGTSPAYTQIGNAVPCKLAQKVAETVLDLYKLQGENKCVQHKLPEQNCP